MNVVYEPAAIEDVVGAIDRAASEFGARIAGALAAEIDRAVVALRAHPLLGTPQDHSVRALPLHRFPFTIHYRVEPDVLRILAFAHQRRRPGSWVERR